MKNETKNMEVATDSNVMDKVKKIEETMTMDWLANVVESKSNTTTPVSGLKIEEIKRLGKIAAGNMVVSTYAQIKEKLGIDVNYFTPVVEFAKINKTLRKLSQNGLNYAAIRHDNTLVDVAYIDFKKMKRALR